MVETFGDNFIPGTSVAIFVVIGGKVEWFCQIWGIYANFAKRMAYSS